MPKQKTQIIEPIDGTLDQVSSRIFQQNIMCEKRLPQALYQGDLPIDKDRIIEFDAYVLDNGKRVLNKKGMGRALGLKSDGGNAFIKTLSGNLIRSKMPDELWEKIQNPLIFNVPPRDLKCHGYEADILIDICDFIIDLREDLLPTQKFLAEQAELIIRSVAKVGIIALVDEATGYQYDRKHDALRLLLNQYVAEGMQKWMKMFPDTFFESLDKLYCNPKTTPRKRPQYYGGFINRHIYEPIEHGYVKEELDKLNITDQGKRKGRFHQWLNDNGKNILMMQIGKVQGLMEIFDDIDSFKKAIKKQKTISVAPYLFDEMNNIIE